MLGMVAIVGRPNVGKSTIFNRIAGERISIVEDLPGVTRDRIYAKGTWLTKDFSIIDTGGIDVSNVDFASEVTVQAQIAIAEADVIIFVVDGRQGVTSEDQYISKLLLKSGKPVIVAVNKIDDYSLMDQMYDFFNLGFGDVFALSGSHGIGFGDMLDRTIELLPNEHYAESDGQLKFSIIGRPNVGKSSLTNAILGEERTIVSNIEGTTRDAIDTSFERNGRIYTVVDTAGMRKKGRIFENVEKYSMIRALNAIEKSEVIIVVIDASVGVIEQDLHVAGYAHESGKGVIIVVNKWDLVEKDEKTMAKTEKQIREYFKYLDYAKILFVSAKTKQRVPQLFDLIDEAYDNNHRRISTSLLNDVLLDAQAMNPTTTFHGGRLKIYYANQVSVAPPTFVLFVNDPQYLHFSYKRYLENCLRERFNYEGTPIHIIARKRD